VLVVSAAVFCLVYGFSNAATHTWATPSTYGFLAAGVALGLVFARWQGRAGNQPRQHRDVLRLPRVEWAIASTLRDEPQNRQAADIRSNEQREPAT